MSDSFDVIMAAYPAADPAQRDFDALVELVQDKTVRSEGVILVDHAADGRVRVTQTGDHLGRRGLGWGGGVGLVVGLFSPPLLASIVAGGAAGALAGKFARHRMDSGIERGLGDKLAPGTAVVIAVVDDGDRLAAERAVPLAFSSYAGMDIGRDNGLVVDLDYEDRVPYAFTGTVKKVVFDLKPTTHEDEQALHEHAQVHGIGHGAAG